MHPCHTLSVVALVGVLVGCPTRSRACTAFSVPTPEGQLLAKGFDWVTGEGWVVVNERGRTRSMLFPGDSPTSNTWTSRFASLSELSQITAVEGETVLLAGGRRVPFSRRCRSAVLASLTLSASRR